MKKYFFFLIFISLLFFGIKHVAWAAVGTGCCYDSTLDVCNSGVAEDDCLSSGYLFDANCNTYPTCEDLGHGGGCCVVNEECTRDMTEDSCSGFFDAACGQAECLADVPEGGTTDAADKPVEPFTPQGVCADQTKYYGQASGLLVGISDVCYGCGACGLCDFLQVGNNVARWIFGIMGGVALIMFIWGGTSMLMSFGNAEKVQGGKKVLTSALFGLLIIFLAWQLVHVLIFILAGGSFEKIKLFADSSEKNSYLWFNPCDLND